jgi:hypothetical protein
MIFARAWRILIEYEPPLVEPLDPEASYPWKASSLPTQTN